MNMGEFISKISNKIINKNKNRIGKELKNNNYQIKEDLHSLNCETFIHTIYCCLAYRQSDIKKDLEYCQTHNIDQETIQRLKSESEDIEQVSQVIINDNYFKLMGSFFSFDKWLKK